MGILSEHYGIGEFIASDDVKDYSMTKVMVENPVLDFNDSLPIFGSKIFDAEDLKFFYRNYLKTEARKSNRGRGFKYSLLHLANEVEMLASCYIQEHSKNYLGALEIQQATNDLLFDLTTSSIDRLDLYNYRFKLKTLFSKISQHENSKRHIVRYYENILAILGRISGYTANVQKLKLIKKWIRSWIEILSPSTLKGLVNSVVSWLVGLRCNAVISLRRNLSQHLPRQCLKIISPNSIDEDDESRSKHSSPQLSFLSSNFTSYESKRSKNNNRGNYSV